MALQYTPTKLDPKVVELLDKDVEKNVFTSKNAGINAILKKHYKIKAEKKKKE